MQNNLSFHSKISSEQRVQQMQQEPRLIWFTGHSGSGKSTLALRLEHHLFHLGYKVYLLDEDNLHGVFNSDLESSEHENKENIRRVGEIAKLMLDAGLVVICDFVSPIKEERELVKSKVGEDKFTEIYVNCPLTICEARDTKGLYSKFRKGNIPDVTDFSTHYEAPASPYLEVHTDAETIDESVYKLINYIEPLLEVKYKPTAFVTDQSESPEPFSFML